MILYIENPKDTTRKLLVLINESGKVSGYKINAKKKYLAFLYTNNKMSERKTKETISFTIATMSQAWLSDIHFTFKPTYGGKRVVLRYWWKKSKTTQKDGAIYHVLRLKKINIVKMMAIPKGNYRFNAILIKLCNPYQIMQSLSNPYQKSLSMAFVTELGQKVLQFVWKHKDPEKEKPSWERKMKQWGSGSLTSG